MFGGTGTVAVVADKVGRHFIHIDISKKYCEIAEQRLETSRMLKEFPFPVERMARRVRIVTDSPLIRAAERKAPQRLLLDKRIEYDVKPVTKKLSKKKTRNKESKHA
jgi:hypothetical protein